MNLEALKVVPPGEHGFPRGTCESCSLYIWSEGAYQIPKRGGYFCTILCVECELFGNGNCRWCGRKLDTAKKFCTDNCRTQSNSTKFGDGTRLLNYLARYHPATYRELSAKSCENCGDPMTDKREDASFCTSRCKVAFHRKSGNSGKSGNSRNTPQRNQQVTAVKSKSGVAALVA